MKNRIIFLSGIIAVCAVVVFITSCTFEDSPDKIRETIKESKTYTVTYNSQGGSEVPNQKAAYKTSLTQPENPAKGVDLFGGWYTEPYKEGAYRWQFNSDLVTGNLTLYARWADAATARSVIFMPDGGTPEPLSPIIVLKDEKVPAPVQPVKTNHLFRGWFTDPGLTAEWEFNNPVGDQPNNTLFLYAKWELIKYFVYFYSEGSPIASDYVSHGSKLSKPVTEPVKADHAFYAWYRDTDFTLKWDFDNDIVTSVVNLYAGFVPGSIPGYTLAEKLEWLSSNAQSDNDYELFVFEDENLQPHELFYRYRNNIKLTLKSYDDVYTITLGSNGSMFTVGEGVTLVLDSKLTFVGLSGNNTALIRVNHLGALEMKTGIKITGNSNSAFITGNGGGGVCLYRESRFTMSGGEISGNSAVDGGGIFMYGGCTVAMSGGEIKGNTASQGGGVYLYNSSISGSTAPCDFTMSGGEISDNTASVSGGGVYLNNGYVSGNTSFTMSGPAKISSNKSTGTGTDVGGGGIYMARTTGTSNFTINGGEISGNSASGSGGGAFIFNGNFNIGANASITGNYTTSFGSGGHGVLMRTSSTVTMTGGKISGNYSTFGELNGLGGGMYVRGGTFNMSGGIIGGSGSDCNKASSGGGVYLNTGIFNMSGNAAVSGNICSNSGGGVNIGYAAKFYMSGGVISGNNSQSSGGGVFVNTTSADTNEFHMTGNASVYGNIASTYGGGVYVNSTGMGSTAIFTKTGTGKVTGNNETNVNDRNTVSAGDGRGHGVFVNYYNWRRETTAGSGVDLDSTKNAANGGGWET